MRHRPTTLRNFFLNSHIFDVSAFWYSLSIFILSDEAFAVPTGAKWLQQSSKPELAVLQLGPAGKKEEKKKPTCVQGVLYKR